MKFPPIVSLFTLLLVSPAFNAHHSVLPFDGTRPTTLRGVLRSVDWRNPHVYFQVDVTDSAGSMTTWSIEAESPLLLERLGWAKANLVPNQLITVLGAPARDGKPILRCRTITLVSGSELPCFPLDSRTDK